MTSITHVLELIQEGEKNPSEINDNYWKDLKQYIDRLEDKQLNKDPDKEIQEETPVSFNFNGVQEEMDTLEAIVYNALRSKPELRNDFQKLEWFIKTQIQNLDLNTFEEYTKAMKSSSIQRARRKVVEDNPEFEPDDEVKEAKQKRENEMRRRYSKSNTTRKREARQLQ